MKKTLPCLLISILMMYSCALIPIRNQPGTYPIHRVFYSLTWDNATITVTIDQFEILPDRTFRIYVTWKASIRPGYWEYISKGDDSWNPDMNCHDDLDRRYDHSGHDGVGPCRLYDGQSQSGWFEFPALDVNATALFFHDDDQGRVFTIFD